MAANNCKNRIVLAALTVLVSFFSAGCSFAGQKEPQATFPESRLYQEGLYLLCDNGAHLIVIDDSGPCVMRPGNDLVAFDHLTAGDRIRVEMGPADESYPMQATVYGIEKLSDGEFFDIDADTLASLAEMGWIEDWKNFDPDAFGAYIPNESAQVLFYYKIPTSRIYLYFCLIRQRTPEGNCDMEAPARDFAVYYTDDGGVSIGRLSLKLPNDLAYASIRPIYAGPGAGSGECEFILEMKNGGDTFYVSFNNFSYTGEADFMEFNYAGVMPEETVNEYRQWNPDLFH